MSAFSTFAQFGVVGTNQLYFAAFANGASCGLEALMRTSVAVLGMFPALSIPRSASELVNSLIQSAASEGFLLPAGIARSEPPRKVGMNRPLMWLGIGYAPMSGASDGLPLSLFNAYGHSQPLPMNAATCPLAKTSPCCGFASSPVRFARDSERTMPLRIVSALIAFFEFS